MASSTCTTATSVNADGIKVISTTCTTHVPWWAANWGWIVLVTAAVLAIGYVLAQWWDRRAQQARIQAHLTRIEGGFLKPREDA